MYGVLINKTMVSIKLIEFYLIILYTSSYMSISTIPIKTIKKTFAFGSTILKQTIMSSPTMPNAFSVENNMYYYADELKTFCPKFFVGTSKTIRVIIERKKIPESEYIYALLKGTEWNILDATSKKAKLLIGKDWVDTNFNKADEPRVKVVKPKIIKVPVGVPVPSAVVVDTENVEVVDNIEEEDVVNIEEEDVVNSDDEIVDEIIEEATEIFELNEEDKFKDVNGNVLEIETRGERQVDKIYFNMTDVSVAFGMPNLRTSLLHKDKGYERNVDYKLFNLKGVPPSDSKKTTNKKRLYLTYEGMLRLLFVSRNPNATVFRKWATTKLFTIQMGTTEQKEELGANLLKISLKQFKDAFKAYTSKFPCIYLLELGTVGTLRELFSISIDITDDVIVYKYGFTDDIVRRFTEHTRDYGKLKGVNVYLSQFTLIDVKNISDAENDIRQFFNDFGKALPVEGRNELVTLNTRELKQVRGKYDILRNYYAGSTDGLQKIIEELKLEIFKKNTEHYNEVLKRDMEHDNEILKKVMEHDNEIFKKVMEHANEIFKKDNEILKKVMEHDNEILKRDMEYKINNEIQIGIINCKDKEILLQIEISKNKELLLQIEISKNISSR